MIREHRFLGVVAAAHALSLGTRSVNKIAKRNGIKFETPTAANKAERQAELIPALRRLVGQFDSQTKLAEALGITRGYLKSLADSEGITLPVGRLG